jgi:hypothetical protein
MSETPNRFWYLPRDAQADIAAAIREAVCDEREACIAVADRVIIAAPLRSTARATAEQIAAALRARAARA